MLKFYVGQEIHAYGVLSTLYFVEVLISHKYEIVFMKMEETLISVIVKYEGDKIISSLNISVLVSVSLRACPTCMYLLA